MKNLIQITGSLISNIFENNWIYSFTESVFMGKEFRTHYSKYGVPILKSKKGKKMKKNVTKGQKMAKYLKI